MDDREKIEEAHGLWEIAVARVSTLAQAGATVGEMWDLACRDERATFAHWQAVSNRVTKG